VGTGSRAGNGSGCPGGAPDPAAQVSRHVACLPDEVEALLRPRPGAVLVDGTGGAGEHADRLAGRVLPGGRLLVLDRDPEAIRHLEERFRGRAEIRVRRADFREIGRVLVEEGILPVDGILLDLGVSSFALDDPKRGLSFQVEGPLDMRFSPDVGATAADLVNRLHERELARILHEYGEEPYARRIASAIVEARRRRPLRTTGELAEVIRRGAGRRLRRIDPCTLTFQALRIAVNDELGALRSALPAAFQALKPGGRVAVIAFHSLEDRLVKEFFRAREREDTAEILTSKPVRPSDAEVRTNPRARSARLRVLERRVA